MKSSKHLVCQVLWNHKMVFIVLTLNKTPITLLCYLCGLFQRFKIKNLISKFLCSFSSIYLNGVLHLPHSHLINGVKVRTECSEFLANKKIKDRPFSHYMPEQVWSKGIIRQTYLVLRKNFQSWAYIWNFSLILAVLFISIFLRFIYF